jgi:small subunit ribosomal protein S20
VAQHKSAEIRARQSQRRARINQVRHSRLRTAIKEVELALAAGDKAKALAALKRAQPEIDRGAAKGVIKKRTGSRKLSRLVARAKALS